MLYLLDADSLIRAKRAHYGFDFCPAWWDWLVSAHAAGKAGSVERVKDELLDGNDELRDWARERRGGFFRPVGEETIVALRRVAAWIAEQEYTAQAVHAFTQVADYFLVGEALAGKHLVVTHEVRSTSTRKIKIPDVCEGLGIDWLTPFEMLRREKARFVLGAPV